MNSELNNVEALQKQIGNKIRSIRESKGIKNYEKFAIRNDLNRSHYWSVEKGEVNITMKTLCKILNALEIKIEDFFQDLENEST